MAGWNEPTCLHDGKDLRRGNGTCFKAFGDVSSLGILMDALERRRVVLADLGRQKRLHLHFDYLFILFTFLPFFNLEQRPAGWGLGA